MSIVVQLLWPAGERWKATCAMPAGSEADPVRVTPARRFVPGSSWVAVGPVLSTLTVVTGPLNELPAMSVVTARKSKAPSESDVVFQTSEYGLVVSVASAVHVP